MTPPRLAVMMTLFTIAWLPTILLLPVADAAAATAASHEERMPEPEWLITMTKQAALALPSATRAQLTLTVGQPEDESAFVASAAAATAVRELALPGVHTIQPEIPFKYRDPSFFSRTAAAERGEDVYDTSGLKDPNLVERALRYYAAHYSALTKLEVFGETTEHRPLLALRIASDPADMQRPVVLLFAAEHGDEPSTPEYPLNAARYLLTHSHDETVRRWLTQLAVVVVPLVNPDGAFSYWHRTEQIGRKNQRRIDATQGSQPGVDLNRNFPFLWNTVDAAYGSNAPANPFYRGAAPASEPEVQALMRLAERVRPMAAISYHGAAAKILVPYTIAGAVDPKPSNAWAVAAALGEHVGHRFERRKYAIVRNLYPVDGTSQDWLHNAFGTVALLVEVPYNAPIKPAQIREGVEYSRPIWQYLLNRWLDGPSLSVHTRRAPDLAAIEAHIALDEVALASGEDWTSSAQGWLHYLLPAAGRYTVRARLGEREVSTTCTAKRGVTTLEVVLP